MRRRGKHTFYDRISGLTPAPALFALLSLLLLSCAGGSGSSGFDLAENTAIETALDEQRCVESDGLTICPAGMATQPIPDSTETPTATPPPPTATPTPTPTPTPEGVDAPTGTPSAPPAQVTPTATPESTATPTNTSTAVPTPTVGVGMGIDTSFDASEAAPCFPSDMEGVCLLPFAFAPRGFSEETSYQVAARFGAEDPWELYDAVDVSIAGGGRVFEANIPIDTGPESATGIVLQTAVLAFVDQSPLLPAGEIIERLAESGADFAFVDPLAELSLTP